MPIAAPLILGGAAVGSALIGSSAARSASKAQVGAEQSALAQQQAMFNKTQANFQPWLDVGKGANYTLGAMYGIGQDGNPTPQGQDFSKFTNSPDYQFAQQQGTLGLQRYENAAGLGLSGGALRDVSQFNQGLASQQFGNYFNRLMSLSQLGASSAASAAGSAGTFSGQIGNTTGNIGASQASGIVGGANAITGGINSGIQNSLLYNAINRSSYASPTAPNPAIGGNAAVSGGGGNIFAGNPFGTY